MSDIFPDWQDSRAILCAYLVDAVGLTLETYKSSLCTNGSAHDPKQLAEWQKASKVTLSHLDLLLRIVNRLAGTAEEDPACDEDDPAARHAALSEVGAFDRDHPEDCMP